MTVTNVDIQKIMEELNDTHFERQDAIQACVLALLAGEHAFLLGEPGTTKSYLSRDLASRLIGAQYFETLLSRTRPAEAVLGPLDLPLLRDTGAFRRKAEGTLLRADIAFLDELGNMSPTLGHDVHSILNERTYHEVDQETGESVRSVPLSTAFTAGNDIPTNESDDARALWDRIVIRCKVEYIKSGGNFARLFEDKSHAERTTVNWTDLRKVIETEINEIPIPPKVIDTLFEVRDKLRLHSDSMNPDGITLSDRRWKACAKVLKAQAWLKGRDMVNEIDLLALKFVLWNEPSQIDTVERILIAFADKVSDQIRTLKDNIVDLQKGITERKGHSKEQRSDHATHTLRKMKAIKQELIRLETEHSGHEEIKRTIELFKSTWQDMFKVLLDQDPADFKTWWSKS
jgi:MoxR-like ATPase